MAPSSRRRRAWPALAGGAALPEDAVYEILLRLPATDLCRLRAVCRPWHSLLSDPAFAAAHAARHPEPHIVAGGGYGKNNKNGVIFSVKDLSGRVVRHQVRRVNDDMAGHDQMVSVQGDLVCLAKRSCKSCVLLNLATGAVCVALPEELLEEHPRRVKVVRPWPYTFFALGQVAATGEYKVLRALHLIDYFLHHWMLCEVSTLNGDIHGQWRGTKAPPYDIMLWWRSSVTINGIVYFFLIIVLLRDTIAPFNLETEEWMPSIQGPLSFIMEEEENAACLPNDHMERDALSLAVLNGCLVLAVHRVPSSMDLFLMDVEKVLQTYNGSLDYGS